MGSEMCIRDRSLGKIILVINTFCFFQKPWDFFEKTFFLPGSTIFEILPITFYPIGKRKSDIVGLQKWLELLKSCNLMEFVKNNSLEKNDSEYELGKWYYIGPTSS